MNVNGKIDLIEVTYKFDEDCKKKIIKAMDELKIRKASVVTWDEEGEIRENDKVIKIYPLLKWLLSVNYLNF